MLGAVADILKRRGTEGWLVGGSVRDRMLGRYSPDLDVAVADDAQAVGREVAAALRLPWFALSERHPTYRVLGVEGHVDVAAVRGGSILADLGRRDFTVNAMALPVAAGAEAEAAEAAVAGARDTGAMDGSNAAARALPVGDALLDPFDGAVHLREGRLVAVSEHIFTEDPLRLMRAARFCHTLGLRLDDGLARMVRRQAPELSAAAAERVVNELCLTLASGRAPAAVRLWYELGLLTVVLPELGAPGDSGLAGPALLERLDEIIAKPGEWFPEAAAFLTTRLSLPVDGLVSRPVALRLAGMMQAFSPEQARAAGRRLKLSSALTSLLLAIARRRVLAELLPEGAAVSRAAVLFMWDVAPCEPEAVLVATAEAMAAAAVGPAAAADEAGRRLMVLAARRASGGMAPCPVDGDLLMRELKLESGPALGRALREARLAWEAGEAASASELLALARAVVS